MLSDSTPGLVGEGEGGAQDALAAQWCAGSAFGVERTGSG